MAMSSGLFFLTFEDMLINGNGAGLNLESENQQGALFEDGVSPTFDTDTAYGATTWSGGNEVTAGNGYTSGGKTYTNTEVTVAAGVLKFDADNMSWTSSTITNAEGVLLYFAAATDPADAAILAVDFGGPYSTNNGTFTIQWNSGGIFTIDLVPS